MGKNNQTAGSEVFRETVIDMGVQINNLSTYIKVFNLKMGSSRILFLNFKKIIFEKTY